VAASGALLAFDYDGTLAPTGSDVEGARMRPESVELLRSLAHAAPVAIITGRSVHDVTRRLEGISVLATVGNHGAEPSRFARRAAREVAAWLPLLKSFVATEAGVVIENKAQSVSVHYWDAPEPSRTLSALGALLRTFPHAVTVVQGIGLVNLIPKGAPNKGDALARLVKAHNLPGALFVGDELTDESAFERLRGSEGLGVRVGASKASAATFHIPTQMEMDAMLTELLVGRTRQARTRRTSALLSDGATQ